jgi:2-polyprenyl-3-methyl-5-hydroxy-6-metoxy-1,4-benzoquinol methylase
LSAPTSGADGSACPLVCPRCSASLTATLDVLACRTCNARFTLESGIWELTLGEGPRTGYDPHYFPGIANVDSRHFWFVSRRELILDALRREIPDLSVRALFDIGCGAGGLIEYLESQHVPVAGGCDSYREGLHFARKRIFAPLFLVPGECFPPLAPNQSLVGMFDVLEHIEDDEGTLRAIAERLGPKGVLALTVPAHPFLFDEADRLAHHHRRYRREELRAKLERAGLTVLTLTHFMALLVPGVLVARAAGWVLAPVLGPPRKRRDLELRVVPVINGVLRAWLRIERAWLRRGSLPFGTSLLAIARRSTCEGAG